MWKQSTSQNQQGVKNSVSKKRFKGIRLNRTATLHCTLLRTLMLLQKHFISVMISHQFSWSSRFLAYERATLHTALATWYRTFNNNQTPNTCIIANLLHIPTSIQKQTLHCSEFKVGYVKKLSKKQGSLPGKSCGSQTDLKPWRLQY